MQRSEIKKKAKENLNLCWGNQAAVTLFTFILACIPVISGPARVSMESTYYKVSQGEKAELRDTLTGFKKSFGPAFLTEMLQHVLFGIIAIVAVGAIFIVGGLVIGLVGLLFKSSGLAGIILPVAIAVIGIIASVIIDIMVGISYAMSFYLLVREPELDGAAPLKKSRELMNGHKKELFWLVLSFIGWDILAVCIPPLVVYVFPYQINAYTIFFNDLYEQKLRQDTVSNEGARFCNTCGEKVSVNSKFCLNCGAKLDDNEP